MWLFHQRIYCKSHLCLLIWLCAPSRAQVLTPPFRLGTFGYLVPGGIPASLVVSPLISIFFIAGVVCIVLAMVFPILTPMLGVIVKLLYTFAVIPVNFFSKIPALEFL